MNNRRTVNRYLSLVFAALLTTSDLLGQVSLQNRTPIDVPVSAQLLISRSGDIVGYWTEHEFSLGSKTVEYKDERVLKVLSTTSEEIQQFAIITVKQPIQFTSRTMTISVLTGEGEEVSSWQIDVPWDNSFPSVIPVDGGNRIVITDPQSQEVRLLNEDGTLSESHSLFQNDDQDHEKTLVTAYHSPDHVYLAGMKSASLNKFNNVVLFSWNLNESPIEITGLSLTVLRSISLSTGSFAALSGTVTSGQGYEQKPRLILLSLEDLTTVSYDILPKKMMWVEDRLFAADSRQLSILQSGSDKPLKQFQFSFGVIPLDIFSTRSSVHLLFAEDSRYSNGKSELGNVSIYSIDLQTLDHSEISVSRDFHKVVKVLPAEDETFFLQLDGELLEYMVD